MALGSTQRLNRNEYQEYSGGIGWPALKADNLTAICELIVYEMWNPRRLTTLGASTASYSDSFTLYIYIYIKEKVKFIFHLYIYMYK
jgi:hypothetical protein